MSAATRRSNPNSDGPEALLQGRRRLGYSSSGMLKCKLWQFSVAIFTFILCKILIICNLSNIYLAIKRSVLPILHFYFITYCALIVYVLFVVKI